jgi:hypothetical protein
VDRILALLPWYDPAAVARRHQRTADVHQDAIAARIEAERAVAAIRRVQRVARGAHR